MINEVLFAEIWNRIDESEKLDDESRAPRLENCIQELRELYSHGESRAAYPIGYAYYCHPGRVERKYGIHDETVKWLSIAIENGVETALSNLYLAYHYFDFEEYETASTYACNVNFQKLDWTIQPRAKELVLCIEMFLHGISASVEQIRNYASYVKSLDEWDIPPLNLIAVMRSLATKTVLDDKMASAIRELDASYPVLEKNAFSNLFNDHVRPSE